MYDAGELDDIGAAAWGAGSVVCVAVGFVVLYWLLVVFVFLPGNVVWVPETAEDAVAKINAGHVTILGFVSLVLYKLRAGGRTQVKAEKAAAPEAEIDTMINTIE